MKEKCINTKTFFLCLSRVIRETCVSTPVTGVTSSRVGEAVRASLMAAGTCVSVPRGLRAATAKKTSSTSATLRPVTVVASASITLVSETY